MFSSVAAATDASNVIAIVVGDVCAALTGSAPATSVVYAGVPLSATTWSNVTVTTVVAALADATLIGVVACGFVAVSPRSFGLRLFFVLIALGIGISWVN